MTSPRLACCSDIRDVDDVGTFARAHGLDGVEWTFRIDTLPDTPAAEEALMSRVAALAPLEVRYHCAFDRTDMGDEDVQRSRAAMGTFRRVCRLVAKLRGEIVTLHVGLGHDSTLDLSWERTLLSLSHLVGYAESLGVRVCLENLAWGWTSRPELFEKLVRKTGCWVTLDIGHAHVSPSITTQQYQIEDFVAPQAGRVRGAHVYHAEDETGHIPPRVPEELAARIALLQRLPACDWWVLELRNRADLLQTLGVVRRLLAGGPTGT